MKRISGSCLCGSVKFEMDDSFQSFYWCHCTECRKSSGTAHVSNLFTAPDNIQWIEGISEINRFDLPGQDFSNAFCRQCGSNVPYVSKSGTALIVPAGSLDQTPSSKPPKNIYWSERADWYDSGVDSQGTSRFSGSD